MNTKNYLDLIKKEVENNENKIGQIGIIEYHLKGILKRKEELEEELNLLNETINYLEIMQKRYEGK